MKKFYFKEKIFKITDHYAIKDEKGQEIYFLDQDLKLIGYKANIKNLITSQSFQIERRILNLFPTYEVLFEDGSKLEVKMQFSILKRKVNVYYKNEEIKLEGKIFDFNFDIYTSNNLIASIDKKIISLSDQYELTVIDEKYSDVLVALTICLNDMKDISARNSN